LRNDRNTTNLVPNGGKKGDPGDDIEVRPEFELSRVRINQSEAMH